MKVFTIALFLLWQSSAVAQVYKCDIGGRVTYSQIPCGESAEKLNIQASSASRLSGTFADDERRRAEYLERHPATAESVATAIRAGVVVPGMSEAEVIAALGDPIRRNLTQTSASSLFQWVYAWPTGAARYVYFENGVVVATN